MHSPLIGLLGEQDECILISHCSEWLEGEGMEHISFRRTCLCGLLGGPPDTTRNVPSGKTRDRPLTTNEVPSPSQLRMKDRRHHRRKQKRKIRRRKSSLSAHCAQAGPVRAWPFNLPSCICCTLLWEHATPHRGL